MSSTAPPAAYTAAIERLVACGRRMAAANWSPTPTRRELKGMAKAARELADRVEAMPAWDSQANPAEVAGMRDVAAQAHALADRVESGSAWGTVEEAFCFDRGPDVGPAACKSACAAVRDLADSALRMAAGDLEASWADLKSGFDTTCAASAAEAQAARITGVGALREVAAAAQAAEAALPQANERPVERYLALVFVFLRHDHALPRPSTYSGSQDVRELDDLLHAANVGGKYVSGANVVTTELTHTLLVKARGQFDRRRHPDWRPDGYLDIA